MNSKRSYLDSLNAGRTRRPYASLEQLNRSLETLEQHIGRDREEALSRPPTASRQRPSPALPASKAEAPPMARTSRDSRGASEQQPYQSIARDLERVRGQEDGIAAFGKIASELQSLREELRQQMNGGVRREFEDLRRDLERIHATDTARVADKLEPEFERLAGAIQTLAEKSDDRSLSMLRLEIEQMKQALAEVAREESVKSVDRRWDEFDRRFNDFEHRVNSDANPGRDDAAMAGLAERLVQIEEAVSRLPDSLQVRSLEEKVRTLAAALDHFLSQQGGHVSETFNQIEERLNEISRAIVATTVAAQAPHWDGEPFERIEARISGLARQIEEVAADHPSSELLHRLNMISERVEDIAQRRPELAVERLASQMAAIADRIDRTAPQASEILSGIDQRFDVLSGLMERRQDGLLEQGNLLFRELEHRLDEVSDRLERQPASPHIAEIFSGIEQRFEVLSALIERRQGEAFEQGGTMMRELERRLEEVADRISRYQTDAALDRGGLMDVIEARFSSLTERLEAPKSDTTAETLRNLEARLEAIIERLDGGRVDSDRGLLAANLEARLADISARIDRSASQLAALDPQLMRSLEEQVAGLSAHLSQPSAPLPPVEDVRPRLLEMEKAIAGSRESVLEAARQAAENAARSFAGSQIETAAVSGLAQDLKSLESLTRRSEERNSRTFEAIHDTLLKIVERLGSVETDTREPDAPEIREKMTLHDAPSIEAEPTLPGMTVPGSTAGMRAGIERSPAQAAAAAAAAVLDTDRAADRSSQEQPGGVVRSMMGGLARALKGRKDVREPAARSAAQDVAEARQVPTVDLDAPLDPKLANRPLQPGSGAPDLQAIMKRVRDERGPPAKHPEKDAAKSDFIAAARRAAQAAAAEAEVLKRKSDIVGPVKALRLADLIKSRRKPILMAAAAVMIALAGLQLGKAFMSDAADAAAIASASGEIASASGEGEQLDTVASGSTSSMSSDASAIEGSLIAAAPTESSTSPDAETAIDSAAPPEAREDQANAAATVIPSPGAPVQAAADEPLSQPTAREVPSGTPGQVSGIAKPAPLDIPTAAGPLPLRDAAKAGDAKALFEIASRYAEGRGIAADMKKAAYFYERAAELGLAPAQYRLGNFYEKGLGIERDIAAAKKWYRAAAEKGNASAMHNLAVLNAMGADGATDNNAAAQWFIAAAELGVKDSQFNLGILAAKGVGMTQSLEESYKWFALVAKSGDKDAAAKRDEIANALRPEQLKRARAATELWKAKPLDPEANAVDVPDAWREDAKDETAAIDMNKAVKNIQLILNKNGYEAGDPDGLMGGRTKTAIIAFQKDNGLDPTGEVDEKLVTELLKRK